MTVLAPPRRRVPWQVRGAPYALVGPGLLVLVLLFAAPALYNVWLAFHELTPYDALGDGAFVGLENFGRVLTSDLTAITLRNTVLWQTLLTVTLRLVLGVALAVLLQAGVLRRLHLLGVARTMVLIPWMIPPTVAVAAWRWLLDGQSGLVNQVALRAGWVDQGVPFLAETSTVWWCIAAIITWRELPFVVIVLMAALQGVAAEQYEAASIDGAGGLRSFWYVTLPHLRPVLAVVGVLITIQSFNNFVYVWLTTAGGPGTYTQVLATQLYTSAFVDNELGTGAAVGLLMTACMTLLALVYLGVLRRQEDA